MIRKFRVKINDKIFEVEVEELSDNVSKKSENVQSVPVEQPKPVQPATPSVIEKAEIPKETPKTETSQSDGNEKVVSAPMSGVIISVNVKPGDKVSVGQTLLILEAMKMENSIISEYDGVVKDILVRKGDNVETGQELVVIA